MDIAGGFSGGLADIFAVRRNFAGRFGRADGFMRNFAVETFKRTHTDMRRELVENGGVPASLLWMLAVISGLSVANLYYNQPLLNLISADLGVSEFAANLIPMTTQMGYAVGLLFIIPLGDLYKRRTIVTVNFALLTAAMCSIAVSPSLHYILAASFVTGICSVTPQIFIPLVSQFSLPENKARNVGLMLSGLLTGILGSRVVSGIVGEYFGWRTMYFVAAAVMFLCIFVTVRAMPDMPSNFKGTYGSLMRSLGRLYGNAALRLVSVRAGLCFGSFLALWACLAFKLGGEPFYAGNNVIGMLGLCGIAGALTASVVGTCVRRLGVRFFNCLGAVLMILAWTLMYFLQDCYVGYVIGIILIDIGMQCVQISNQTCALSLDLRASNRINTIFMTTYFVGGATGTLLAGTFWHAFGWAGVVMTGISLTGVSLAVTLFSKRGSL